ncbi:Vago-PB, isoform B [Yersinia frederiksenii]|nr:Vago-PB, isoform B [Yersinia frederiksenii]
MAACYLRCRLIRGLNDTFLNIPAKQTVEVIIIITTIVINLC